jgi:hypothetical protein
MKKPAKVYRLGGLLFLLLTSILAKSVFLGLDLLPQTAVIGVTLDLSERYALIRGTLPAA